MGLGGAKLVCALRGLLLPMKITRVLWAPVRWEKRSWKQRSECMKEVHLLQGLAENYQGGITVLKEYFPKHQEVQFYLQVK